MENKHTYSLAFVLGMVLMVGLYVVFEEVTDDQYRTRTDASSATSSSSSSGSSGAVVLTAGTDATFAAYLGVEVVELTAVLRNQLGLLDSCGVLVNEVIENSPAMDAGIERGDVILSINGVTVESVDGLKDIIKTLTPGTRVRIIYARNGVKYSTYAVLGVYQSDDSKTSAALNTDATDWGVSMTTLTPSIRASTSVPGDVTGVIILSVIPGSLADQAGLSTGDIITGVDQTDVASMSDLFTALSEDNNNIALLDVYSQGALRYVAINSTSISENVSDSAPQTILDKIFSVFTGGMPFGDDEDEEEEEGPKGGKFVQDEVVLTASDETAWNRPSEPPGSSSTTDDSDTALNRPSSVPSQSSSTVNETVLFIAILVLIIMFMAYREFNRPSEE
ncbi:MAG: PDZ domain-containing protein [Candidatus Omnitrophica bacterium]|nr:PDZ domain-containing protein [Candidatus Omnitrophota bacterium]